MKNVIVFAMLALVTALASAHAIPTGHYKGQGLWKSQSSQGQYQTSASIGEKSFQTNYVFADGTKKQWNFEMDEAKNGLFNVLSQGVIIGSGYCLEKVSVCHYEIAVGKLKLEESIVQQDKKVYRFGSKDQGQGIIVWQESLEQE